MGELATLMGPALADVFPKWSPPAVAPKPVMRVRETPPFEANSGGVLVLANDTLLVPGPIAGAGLPGLIFVLADDSGDGFSLRGSGNSDNPARRCRPARNKVIGLHCSSATQTAGGSRRRVSVSPNCAFREGLICGRARRWRQLFFS